MLRNSCDPLVSKTVRLPQSVIDIIEQLPGDSFTERLLTALSLSRYDSNEVLLIKALCNEFDSVNLRLCSLLADLNQLCDRCNDMSRARTLVLKAFEIQEGGD